jgi:hypothetical protein
MTDKSNSSENSRIDRSSEVLDLAKRIAEHPLTDPKRAEVCRAFLAGDGYKLLAKRFDITPGNARSMVRKAPWHLKHHPMTEEERLTVKMLLTDPNANPKRRQAAELREQGLAPSRIGKLLGVTGKTIICWLRPSFAQANRDHVANWKANDPERARRLGREWLDQNKIPVNDKRRQRYADNPTEIL